jgi:hypothetical protein
MPSYPPPPTGVVVNNASARGWGSGWPACQTSKQVTITITGGARITVRREISELTRLLLNECVRRGYKIFGNQSGGYNCRAIAGTTIPSNHSWGLAGDVNWNQNPMSSPMQTNIPPWMVSFMWAYGFFWGGWYTGTKDPMHFEFIKTPTAAATLTTALKKALAPKPQPAPQPRRITHPLSGDDMFNPFFVQAPGDPAVYLVTSAAVIHVKNHTHFRFLVRGGIPEEIVVCTPQEISDLIEDESVHGW